MPASDVWKTAESFESSHRKVIAWIHIMARDGQRFALGELLEGTNVASTTAKRILTHLKRLGLIHHSPNGYKQRNYTVTKRWLKDDVMAVIENYELSKVMNG